MSTVISRSPSFSPISKLKMNDKHRLVRTTSIEKIKKFNSFICSQQYIVLPALLSWLKCSRSGLQTSTDHTILLFRSIIFNNLIYRSIQSVVRENVKCDILDVSELFAKLRDALFLLTVVVHVALVLVVLQFCFLLYTIYVSLIPSGFVFLLSCIFVINSFFYKTVCFFISRNQKGCMET